MVRRLNWMDSLSDVAVRKKLGFVVRNRVLAIVNR